jgi:hypothetical protein
MVPYQQVVPTCAGGASDNACQDQPGDIGCECTFLGGLCGIGTGLSFNSYVGGHGSNYQLGGSSGTDSFNVLLLLGGTIDSYTPLTVSQDAQTETAAMTFATPVGFDGISIQVTWHAEWCSWIAYNGGIFANVPIGVPIR